MRITPNLILRVCSMLLLLAKVHISYSQNLVPNYSFELYDTCPDSEAQIERAIGWKNFGGTLQGAATPDYYNACDPGIFNVPNGGLAHQYANSGNAYAAVVTFAPNFYREYIGIELSQTLVVNQKYYISFYTAMAEDLGFSCPSNKIGIRLSTVAYSVSNNFLADNFANVYTDSLVSDTINWTHITGSIVADSAYKYLIIGNCFDDAHTDTLQYSMMTIESYYLIDDVCLSIDSLTCASLTSVPIVRDNCEIKISPNPCKDRIAILFPKNEAGIIFVYDIFGNLTIKKEFSGKREIEINLSSVSKGFYFFKILMQKEKIIIKHFVKL